MKQEDVFIEVYVDDEEPKAETFELQVTETIQLRVSSNIDDQLLIDLVDWIAEC